MGSTGGAILIEIPTCANEDAKGRIANRKAAKRKERNFMMVVVLVYNLSGSIKFCIGVHSPSTVIDRRYRIAADTAAATPASDSGRLSLHSIERFGFAACRRRRDFGVTSRRDNELIVEGRARSISFHVIG